MLEVYHNGKHTCVPKPNRSAQDSFIVENIKKHGVNTTPKELARIEMTAELNRQLEAGVTDMEAIVSIASKLTDRKRIQNIKAQINNHVKSEKHSLSAVAELKSITDTCDKFLMMPT